jgi:MFS family permease
MSADLARAEGPYAVLKHRDFALYLAGRLVAAFGQQMLVVAVGWELYERTHSALALGFVGLAEMIPMFAFTLPAGHMADNYPRKTIIMATQTVMIIACIGLTAISILHLNVILTYISLFLFGIARTFLWPASSSFMPQLVPREHFSKAVTWNTGTFQLSSVLGPAAGGALISVTHHASVVYFIAAVCGMICVVLLWMVRTRHEVAVREKMSPKSLISGFRFVFDNKIILGTITLDMFAVLLGGATSLLPVYAKDILQVGPSGLGLLQAGLPVGSVTMAAALAHRRPLEKAGRAMLWAVAAFGLATIGFGISHSFWLSFAMLVICGAVDNISMVVRHTLVQLLTPDTMRGRVSAVNSLFIGTSNELGGFESGLVAHFFGPIFSVVSGGVGTIVVVIAVAMIWPQIRKYGRLDA